MGVPVGSSVGPSVGSATTGAATDPRTIGPTVSPSVRRMETAAEVSTSGATGVSRMLRVQEAPGMSSPAQPPRTISTPSMLPPLKGRTVVRSTCAEPGRRLVSVTACVAVVPTSTDPKLKARGATRVPWAVARMSTVPIVAPSTTTGTSSTRLRPGATPSSDRGA